MNIMLGIEVYIVGLFLWYLIERTFSGYTEHDCRIEYGDVHETKALKNNNLKEKLNVCYGHYSA